MFSDRILTTVLHAMLLLFIGNATATEVVDWTGQENFERLCAACHGVSGTGDGPVAAEIIKGVPDLTRIAERNGGEFPRQLVKNTIDGRWRVNAHGTQQMPVWGYEFYISDGAGAFSEVTVSRTLDDLVDYIEALQKLDAE
jgi:mono/diheme cytochrome c family protein